MKTNEVAVKEQYQVKISQVCSFGKLG